MDVNFQNKIIIIIKFILFTKMPFTKDSFNQIRIQNGVL